jgi:YVTN family beta-propeller protein
MRIATTAGLTLGAILAAGGTAQATVSHVFVSNSGEGTISLVKCVTANGKNPIRCKEKERKDIGFTHSWPANQYDGHPAWWWTGLSGEVVGVKAKASMSPLKNPNNKVFVDTYDIPGLPSSGANFIGISPDGRTAWNSAREVDRIQEIDTDPGSPTFGTILSEIIVPDKDPVAGEDPAALGLARPCDATITPDGRFFLEPDLAGESLTVVDTWTKQIIHQVIPQPAYVGEKVQPFMATTNGSIVLVENLEGDNTYDIWDVSGLPDEPEHLKKLTQADGIGVDAQTSEFTPDGQSAYLIMRGVGGVGPDDPEASRLDVLDVVKGSPTYLEVVNSIKLPENCRASTGDFSKDGRFFFVNCSGSDEMAIVDSESETVVATVPVGVGPRGLVVR